MAKIGEMADAYEPKKTHNVSELEFISVDEDIVTREGTKKDGTEFTYNVVVCNGEDYRVPDSVLKQLKTLRKEKPKMKHFKVIREGEGRTDTTYQVIDLDKQD